MLIFSVGINHFLPKTAIHIRKNSKGFDKKPSAALDSVLVSNFNLVSSYYNIVKFFWKVLSQITGLTLPPKLLLTTNLPSLATKGKQECIPIGLRLPPSSSTVFGGVSVPETPLWTETPPDRPRLDRDPPPPPVNRIIDRCKQIITFPTTSFASGNNEFPLKARQYPQIHINPNRKHKVRTINISGIGH